ncbi:hypothetical protein DFJ73DRAFT_961710 [Zopfochytrium polystomum]|nr:hypothetical protein DFJ73DRAFT_961710 [Zopfochytrium polystomum]
MEYTTTLMKKIEVMCSEENADIFDTNYELLGFPIGMYDLKADEFRPGRKEEYYFQEQVLEDELYGSLKAGSLFVCQGVQKAEQIVEIKRRILSSQSGYVGEGGDHGGAIAIAQSGGDLTLAAFWRQSNVRELRRGVASQARSQGRGGGAGLRRATPRAVAWMANGAAACELQSVTIAGFHATQPTSVGKRFQKKQLIVKINEALKADHGSDEQ